MRGKTIIARRKYHDSTHLDTADCGRSNDSDTLLVRLLVKGTRLRFRNALGNDGNCLDLLRVVKNFHHRSVHGAKRCKVHDHRNVGVLRKGFLHLLKDWHQNFFGSPIKLKEIIEEVLAKWRHINLNLLRCVVAYLDVMIRGEWKNHGCNGWLLSLAHVVKIQHPLHGSVLQSINYASRGGCKVLNLVVRFVVGLLWLESVPPTSS